MKKQATLRTRKPRHREPRPTKERVKQPGWRKNESNEQPTQPNKQARTYRTTKDKQQKKVPRIKDQSVVDEEAIKQMKQACMQERTQKTTWQTEWREEWGIRRRWRRLVGRWPIGFDRLFSSSFIFKTIIIWILSLFLFLFFLLLLLIIIIPQLTSIRVQEDGESQIRNLAVTGKIHQHVLWLHIWETNKQTNKQQANKQRERAEQERERKGDEAKRMNANMRSPSCPDKWYVESKEINRQTEHTLTGHKQESFGVKSNLILLILLILFLLLCFSSSSPHSSFTSIDNAPLVNVFQA